MGTTLEHAPAAHGDAWIDLHKPDEARLREVEAATGLSLPRLEDLQEIESSSRLYVEGGALFMSFPVLTPYQHGEPTRSVPVGLVLQPRPGWSRCTTPMRRSSIRRSSGRKAIVRGGARAARFSSPCSRRWSSASPTCWNGPTRKWTGSAS